MHETGTINPNDTAAAAERATPQVCMWCGESIENPLEAITLEPGRLSHAPACPAALTVALNAAEVDERGETAFCALAYDAVRALQAESIWILGWSQIRERAWRRLCDHAAKAGFYPSADVRRRLNSICRRAWALSKRSIRTVQEARAREEHVAWCKRVGFPLPVTGGLIS